MTKGQIKLLEICKNHLNNNEIEEASDIIQTLIDAEKFRHDDEFRIMK